MGKLIGKNEKKPNNFFSFYFPAFSVFFLNFITVIKRLLKRLKGTFFLFGFLFPFFRLFNYYFVVFDPFSFLFMFFLVSWFCDWFLCSSHMIYIAYVSGYVFFLFEGFWLKAFTFLFNNFFALPFFIFITTCIFWFYPLWLNIFFFFYVFYLIFIFFFFRCFFTESFFLDELYYERGFICLLVYSQFYFDIHDAQETSASFSLNRFGFIRPYNSSLAEDIFSLQQKSVYTGCTHTTFTRYQNSRLFLVLLFSLNTIFGLFTLRTFFFL